MRFEPVCPALPKSVCRSRNASCWGSEEAGPLGRACALRSWGWSLTHGISALGPWKAAPREGSSRFRPTRTQREGGGREPGKGFLLNRTMLVGLHLGLSGLQGCEREITAAYKARRLWYLVKAAPSALAGTHTVLPGTAASASFRSRQGALPGRSLGPHHPPCEPSASAGSSQCTCLTTPPPPICLGDTGYTETSVEWISITLILYIPHCSPAPPSPF